jgi:HAD superfamily hydrolase (TIGR01490 family)
MGLDMNLALFDFDGTVTRKDSWTEFLRFSATPRRIAAATLLLSPVIVGYKTGLVSARRGRPLVARFAFSRTNASAIRQLGRTFASERLPGMVRRRALERIAWHRRQSDAIVVVSASLDVYLTPWCASIGVDVICTQLEEVDGLFTGRYLGGDCCGVEKARRISQRYDLSRYQRIYAYGDSEEDREMLELAHEKSYRWQTVTSSVVPSSDYPPAA